MILGGFAALFLALTGAYNPTAALFPRWVAVATLGFLLVALVFEIRGNRRPKLEPVDDESPVVSNLNSHWLTVLALQAGYLAGIYLIGFTGATVLYLLVAPTVMRFRDWRTIVLHAISLTVVITGSFIWFFHIRLPKGLLWELF